MFLEQKTQTDTKAKGKAHADDSSKAPTLVLQDVRPIGWPAACLILSFAVFLTVLEFIYTNSCKLNQSIVCTYTIRCFDNDRLWTCWHPASSTDWTA